MSFGSAFVGDIDAAGDVGQCAAGQDIHARNAIQPSLAPERVVLRPQVERQLKAVVGSAALGSVNLAHSVGNSCRTENNRTEPAACASAISSFDVRDGAVAQQAAAFAGGVAEVQDDVADRVVVELRRVVLAGIGRQFQLPLADDARVLERQVALVAQVGLEQAAVVLGRAGDDGLQAAEVVAEAVVFGVLAGVAAIAQRPASCGCCS